MANTRWPSTAVAVLFFAALWTPLIGMLFGAGEFHSDDENRSLAVLPDPRGERGNWFDLARAFTAYFHDHFGFRGTLITAQALLKVKVLGVSSSPDVIIGKAGWLFYTGEKSMDNYLGVLPFTAEERAAWVRLFERREEWLARRGILLLVAIVPDKQSVYPEFLPAIRKIGGRARLDDFASALRSESNVRLLDLRRALLDAKARHSQVYHRTDTHWNAAGVYAAYLQILSGIAKKYPDVRPVPFSGTTPVGNYTAGDLTRMLGLGGVWKEIREPVPDASLQPVRRPDGDLLLRRAGAADRRLVMFGDSFQYPLIPYLGQHFEETVASASSALKPALIAEEHPGIVLFEMVERKLNGPAPRDPLGR